MGTQNLILPLQNHEPHAANALPNKDMPKATHGEEPSGTTDTEPPLVLSPEKEEAKLLQKLTKQGTETAGLGIQPTIGKLHLGLMYPQPPYRVEHKTALILQAYSKNGCLVDCGNNWTEDHIVLMLQQGPHQSALCKKVVAQLRQETQEKIEQGYAQVIQWGDI